MATNLSASSQDVVGSGFNAANKSILAAEGGSEGYTDNLIYTVQVQILFYMIYCIIFLLGVFGNCLVIYTVCRNKAMQTVTNYFILNLALSDILLCVLCVPFTPLYTFLRRWIFGEVLCHLVPCTQAICIYISSLTLTTIAIDRFFVIIYPFRPRMLPRTCIILILCTWLFSIVATMPYAYFVDYVVSSEGTYVCMEIFPEDLRLTFGGITNVMQFVIPFLIMTIMYSLISLKLSTRAKCKPGSKSVRKEQADRERKKRTNHMLIAMVGVFGLSWLPLNLMNILEDVSTNLDLGWEQWRFFHIFFFVAHSIAMSSTCYNPLLYAWLNETFRKEFKEILPCFRRARDSARAANGSLQQARNGLRCASVAHVADDHQTRHTTTTHLPATLEATTDETLLLKAIGSPAEEQGAAQAAGPHLPAPTLVTDL